MSSNIHKVIIGLCLAANVVSIAAIATVIHHRHTANQQQVVDLGTIVVTPANAEKDAVASSRVIDLGVIVVTPAPAQQQYAANAVPAQNGQSAAIPAIETLVQAMDALSPGEYLDNSATMDLLGTLAFDRVGR